MKTYNKVNVYKSLPTGLVYSIKRILEGIIGIILFSLTFLLGWSNLYLNIYEKLVTPLAKWLNK